MLTSAPRALDHVTLVAVSHDTKIRPWELILSLLTLGFCAMIAYQRELIYSKGKWGLLDDHNLSILGIVLFFLVVLVATKPWRRVSLLGSQLRLFSMTTGLFFFLLVTLWGTGWGRHQTGRYEALVSNFGITNFEQGPRRDFNSDLTTEMVGPYLAKDKELLHTLARESGDQLLTNPRAARVVLASLVNLGVSVDQLLQETPQSTFLLACLVAETDEKPWHGLSWVAEPKSSTPAFKAGLLTPEQAILVLKPFLQELENQQRPTLQGLVFSVMNFPSLFSAQDRDLVMEAWAKSFDDLEDLAVEGLVIRAQLKELLGDADHVNLHLDVTGAPPSDYYYQWVPQTLPQMVFGLIRSCGPEIQQVGDPGKADMRLKVHISQIAVYDYRRPNYSYESYYEYRTSSMGSKPWRSYRTRVKRSKQVLTGYSNETQFAPTATVELDYRGQKLDFEPGLIYWHSLTYDKEKGRYQSFPTEDAWRRAWPFGIQDKMYEYRYMTDPENRGY